MMLADGTLRIYSLQNTAEPGEMPREMLVPKIREDLYYSDRVIGVTRFYAAKGADQQISKLVRIWDVPVEIGDYVVADGRDQYRIDLIQPGRDDEGLKVVDLTLVREENHYDVLTEQT